MEETIQFLVKGKVQGVFFRKYILRIGMSMELNGMVRNLSNGDVEIKVNLEPEQLDEFLWQVKLGSENSRVDEVIVNKTTYENFDGFSIL